MQEPLINSGLYKEINTKKRKRWNDHKQTHEPADQIQNPEIKLKQLLIENTMKSYY